MVWLRGHEIAAFIQVSGGIERLQELRPRDPQFFLPQTERYRKCLLAHAIFMGLYDDVMHKFNQVDRSDKAMAEFHAKLSDDDLVELMEKMDGLSPEEQGGELKNAFLEKKYPNAFRLSQIIPKIHEMSRKNKLMGPGPKYNSKQQNNK
ncbi:MAG: hypothetical protein CMJ78_10265 [Planctomycetaceae bacterium]|nr:hypothetical protein [Planctomycetaceae bacterium]